MLHYADTFLFHPDGVEGARGRARTPLSPPSSRSSSPTPGPEPARSKSVPASSPSPSTRVKFIPLSPKSSQTLRRHHRETSAAATDRKPSNDSSSSSSEEPDGHNEYGDEDGGAHYRHLTISNPARRPASSELSDSPVLKRRRRRSRFGDESPSSEKGEPNSDIEELPDRFDASGRPLDPRDPGGWSSRSGAFDYRPRHRRRRARDDGSGDRDRDLDEDGDWSVRGSWGVGGTDPVVVDGIARTIGDVLEGRKSWVGVLGDVLLKGTLPGLDDGGNGSGSGSGGHARRQAVIDDEEDEDDEDRDMARSRRKGKGKKRSSSSNRRDEHIY